jgi:hypothetical protein
VPAALCTVELTVVCLLIEHLNTSLGLCAKHIFSKQKITKYFLFFFFELCRLNKEKIYTKNKAKKQKNKMNGCGAEK